MDIIDPATPVVVATTLPLRDFPLPDGDRTACGLDTRGWYTWPAGMAYNNVRSPCGRCFPAPSSPGRG